jgi:4,5-DOPA dioxygenase extradiol
MQAFFHPSDELYKASGGFNDWLKDAILGGGDVLSNLRAWEKAPGARLSHPREEHLIPLLMTAAAAGANANARVTYETTVGNGEYAMSSYIFE